MTSLYTSHASIGNSTMKDAHDLTTSSFGGPEDFLIHNLDGTRGNEPSFKHANPEQPTESSIGGPEDFSLDIVDKMRRNKPFFAYKTREQPTESSIGGPEDFTADILKYTRSGQGSDSSLRSKDRAIASKRQASDGSGKTTQHPPSYSPIQSPNHRNSSSSSVGPTSNDGESKSTRPSSIYSKTSSTHTRGEMGGTKKPDEGDNNSFALDGIGTESILVKDGKTYRKNIRAGVRQKMQPTVSDDEELDQEDIIDALTLPPLNQIQPEPTMSLPISLLENETTKPLGESTPTQRTADSTVSSQDQTLEDGFDFATSLAHRIQRTPASAKQPEADYSINLSADASELLADGMYRPETFPRNDSFVRDCSDANVAFADRIRGIRPDSAGNTQRPPEPDRDNEMELLRQQLEQMKSELAQKEEMINVLQSRLSAKETEGRELHDVLQTKSFTVAAVETREAALKDAVRAAEERTVTAAAIAAERFAVMKDALLAAEDEAAVAADRAKDAVTAAESRADAAVSRCRQLEKEIKDLTASARAARTEAKRARKEQAEREILWVERSDVLLAECDRRGRAILVKIGEQELPGMRDEKGRQAYRYQRGREWEKTDVVRR